MARPVPRLLLRAHWRARRRRLVLLGAAFGAGLAVFLVAAALMDGAQQSVLGPLADTTTGDLRVSLGSAEIAGGDAWEDARGPAAELERASGGHVSQRWESSQLAVRRDDLEAWSGGLLLGVDPRDGAEAAALAKYLVWGTLLEDDVVVDPVTGRTFVPILVGDKAAARLGLHQNASAGPDFGAVLVLTSGRLREGSQIPITREAVVVGVFDTGLEPFDRFSAFVPLQAARELAGHGPLDPVANALVLRGGDGGAARAVAGEWDAHTVTAERFGRSYLGGILVVLDVATTAASFLLLLVLLLWLAHETGSAVRADLPVLASLRTVGLPTGTVAGTYGAVAAGAVATGAAVALVVGLLLPALPPLPLDAPGVESDLRLHVPADAWWVLPGAVGVALALAAGVAGRRLARVPLLDALRGV